jgi:hypothetical protein
VFLLILRARGRARARAPMPPWPGAPHGGPAYAMGHPGAMPPGAHGPHGGMPIGRQRTVAVSPSAGGAALAGLVCVRGILHGQHFTLGAHGLLIGRDQGAAQVVIPDGRVSGKHLWIGFQDGVLMAIDQGSTNGTFINDMSRGRITRSPLRHGDTVIVSEPDVLTVQVLVQPGGR